jgi:hypothetical protein
MEKLVRSAQYPGETVIITLRCTKDLFEVIVHGQDKATKKRVRRTQEQIKASMTPEEWEARQKAKEQKKAKKDDEVTEQDSTF